MALPSQTPAPVSLRALSAVFGRIGLLSFGGPAAQIALMQRELIEERPWLSEKQFLNALSFCMLLPGPEAMQLATFAGWRLRGVAGGLIAGLLFVLPGALVIFALAALYVTYGDVPLVDTLFLGVKSAVLIIVLEALIKLSGRALTRQSHWVIAALAFIGIFGFGLPFPAIVLAAAIFGAIFTTGDRSLAVVTTSARGTLKTVLIGTVIWILPIVLLDMAMGGGIIGAIGVFFSKLAVVTFGGAYAVLAYMAQEIVQDYGWLTPDEMIDGLGLAETTPGPLILVTEFVAFIAAFREGGYGMGILGGLVALWVTFVPCFIWIFAGAPYVDWIAAQPQLNGALKAITAAVVGVILNLSVWFALHVLFGEVTKANLGPLTLWQPVISSLDWRAVLLAGLSAVLLLRLHLAIGWVLIAAALAALTLGWAGIG